MHAKFRAMMIILAAAACVSAQAQTINEYTVKRAPGKIKIDGKLNEKGWKNAEATVPFVIYTSGEKPKFATNAKMLWDDKYLYIAFIMDDNDVWAATKKWNVGDKCLCLEEVAEVFIDPDGDGENYLEAEINPFGALMSLRLDREFAKGGSGDYSWSYKTMQIGTSVKGTLNKQSDTDTQWICELGFPFSEIAFSSPSLSFPPKTGDSWRINLYRYEYFRPLESNKPELTAWNRVVWPNGEKNRGFHAPNYFGRIIFSSETAGK